MATLPQARRKGKRISSAKALENVCKRKLIKITHSFHIFSILKINLNLSGRRRKKGGKGERGDKE
jgi:hypothetical protein